MSDPVNHHWLPQFLMRPWCDEKGLVTSFYRPHTKVVANRRSPSALGSEDHLYTVVSAANPDPYYFEKEVMTRASDTPGAVMRDRLLSGDIPLPGSLARMEFVRFMLFLFLRRPDVIKTQKAASEDQIYGKARKLEEALKDLDPTYYERHFAEKVEATKGTGEYIALHAALSVVVKHEFVPIIAAREWRVLDFSGSPLDLIMGDGPVQIYTRGDQFDRLEMPLSPRHLLMVGSNEFFARDVTIRETYRKNLAERSNRTQLKRSRVFAVATGLGPDDCHRKMAEAAMPKRRA
ncbi:DUF4238 domain-containing protein [Thalassobaculum sp.]|uniref:DUF4238 domain-containing protein n=1 Tax=Thalassobaculum sp. TaxID=2022740 RepID=UPI0032F0029F